MMHGEAVIAKVFRRLAKREVNPLALPRLTVRRSTTEQGFQQITLGRDIPMIFRKDRALTKGYAIARRTRSALGRVRRVE